VPTDIPLVLGGHSFISQLGNDPPASEKQQLAIVESCLDGGITWFDTTYQPERPALGNALRALGRRDEATILAWNFFTDFSPDGHVGGPEYYRPGTSTSSWSSSRPRTWTALIVVPVDDPEENQRQQELLVEWQRKGYVRFPRALGRDRPLVANEREDNPFASRFGRST
jgi:aryl-alcohol dehydrogenase-like predicted oxidoreductase